MRITCPECRAPLAAADVNLDNLVARCRACDGVFRLDLPAPATHAVARVARPPRDAEVPRPVSLGEHRGLHDLTIRRRWFGPQHVFIALFAFCWDAFLVFWYSMVTGEAPWIFSVFPLIHVAVGVGLTYYALAGFVNRTTVRADDATLRVSHGPLPWPGERLLHRRAIEQLYCVEDVKQGKNGTRTTYEVHAQLTGGRHEKVLSGLQFPDEALYVERAVEKHFGIADVAVAGELAPPPGLLRTGTTERAEGGLSEPGGEVGQLSLRDDPTRRR